MPTLGHPGPLVKPQSRLEILAHRKTFSSGGNAKVPPLSFGTVHSKLWDVLNSGRYDVKLTTQDKRRINC